jgi:hypothetical protein
MTMLDAATEQQEEPFIGTIAGTPGSGKTSLAAAFPDPFMIRTTGERVPRDFKGPKPKSLDIVEKPKQLWDQLMALLNEEHSFQSLLIDSVTGLDAVFSADILASDPKAKGIAQSLGGYGAGFDALAAQHARVRRACEAIRSRRGMNIVFLAHADITTIDPPDGEQYGVWSLRLHKKSLAPFVDSVDLVGFVRQHTILLGEDGKKKAKTTGDRILTAHMTPSSLAKNRYGITEDIEYIQGENPLADYIPKIKRPAKARPETVAEVNEEEGNDNND